MSQMVGGEKGDGKGMKGDGKGIKGDKGDGKGFKGFKGDGKGKGFKGDGKGFKGKKGDGAMVDFGKGKGKFKGGGPAQERVVYQRQSRNAGLHTIEIYQPQFWFDQIEMEEYDALPERYGPSVIGKYTKGIGQVQARCPSDDEDPTSMCMTVTHRLLERMEEKGFNETGRYQPDGVPLGVYHAIGRMDVGTESITDRSKSMKSYVMDIFERYGDGESNIEGVDQYNACYGGQACALAVVNWLESDRWDGRYGIAIATDISEAHPAFLAFVGCACTASLMFPDAPLPHHSQRASCIMHRLDFCKPIGWHDMAPVTDGKYSVECYLDALDCCYVTFKKKMNDRPFLDFSDYNVFHTGGGYHIVKKAFERLLRSERPDIRGEDKEKVLQERLHPSVHLLKRIGPCHTVSSFLNTASVCMHEMERALGKVMIVFTYGSGCASSMYQMRFDDIPYFDPLEVWFIKEFYRHSIKVTPAEASRLHEPYVYSWMKFDYKPFGRDRAGLDPQLLEDDVYYLMEIDKFGRRFYHRGGMKTKPLPKSRMLPADAAEGRPNRKHWGPIPEKKAIEEEKTDMDIRRQIEYDMTYDHEAERGNYVEIGEYSDTYHRDKKVRILKALPDRKEHGTTIEPDGKKHSYFIAGTWSRREPQEMQPDSDGSWSIAITVGENRWEEFYILQDNDPQKRIYPHVPNASKDTITVGPHHGGVDNFWMLDCRDRVDVPEDQVGMPGQKYLITFRWTKLKELTWSRLSGESGEFQPSQYSIAGTWSDFELVDLQQDKRPGWYSTEVQMTSLGVEFKLVRNLDYAQIIYPVPKRGERTGDLASAIQGPDANGATNWRVQDDRLGGVYRLSFFRDPEDCEQSGMRVEWRKTDDRPVVEPNATYYLVGPFNEWGAKGMQKMRPSPDFTIFSGEVTVEEMVADERAPEKRKVMMPFKIVQHKIPERCVHPDKDKCTQLMEHKVVMDDRGKDLAWHIGAHPSDKAKSGDVFTVKLTVASGGALSVAWAKAEAA